jgi:hypothetical protein
MEQIRLDELSAALPQHSQFTAALSEIGSRSPQSSQNWIAIALLSECFNVGKVNVQRGTVTQKSFCDYG